MSKTLLRNAAATGFACAAVLLAAACSGGRAAKPRDSVADAELAVTRAEQARVGDYDAVDLRHARENLSAARAALAAAGEGGKDRNRDEQARWLAARAKVDAELGLARAEGSRLLAQTRAVQREIDERLAPAKAAPPATPGSGS
ncbi:MAG: hypothetical protein NVS9B10_10900 [Nevskia sp.]